LREIQLTDKFNIEKNLKGIKFLIGSGFAFSLMSVCVKAIGGRIPISELVFARASISILITGFLLYKNKIHPWGYQKKLLIIRGLLGTIALFCIFKALTILPIATATVIQYIYPTFTVICAYIILKEFILKRIVYSIIIEYTILLNINSFKIMYAHITVKVG